jgi:hypothetical protein
MLLVDSGITIVCTLDVVGNTRFALLVDIVAIVALGDTVIIVVDDPAALKLSCN